MALKHIEDAQSINDLDYPAKYFKGTKYELNIINACTAKKDMEGWSA